MHGPWTLRETKNKRNLLQGPCMDAYTAIPASRINSLISGPSLIKRNKRNRNLWWSTMSEFTRKRTFLFFLLKTGLNVVHRFAAAFGWACHQQIKKRKGERRARSANLGPIHNKREIKRNLWSKIGDAVLSFSLTLCVPDWSLTTTKWTLPACLGSQSEWKGLAPQFSCATHTYPGTSKFLDLFFSVRLCRD